ncbi:MAG: hypothetical protein JF614_05090 [Acidobacteria bacterium]|nr:hypothetical protein [Acidobacteriota bacterium]
MRTSTRFRTLLLMALCALFAVAAGLAQTPQAPATAAPQAVPSVAEFLATLSSGPSEAPATELLPPSPKFLSTTCTSNADCGPHELCCYPCGIPDCNFVCMRVKRCPLFP